jgi:hypothetical protein
MEFKRRKPFDQVVLQTLPFSLPCRKGGFPIDGIPMENCGKLQKAEVSSSTS